MKSSLFLATLLSLPCLAFVGCGNSSSATPSTTAEATALPSASEVAAAEAEIEQVNNEERAYQNANPVGKKAAKKR